MLEVILGASVDPADRSASDSDDHSRLASVCDHHAVGGRILVRLTASATHCPQAGVLPRRQEGPRSLLRGRQGRIFVVRTECRSRELDINIRSARRTPQAHTKGRRRTASATTTLQSIR